MAMKRFFPSEVSSVDRSALVFLVGSRVLLCLRHYKNFCLMMIEGTASTTTITTVSIYRPPSTGVISPVSLNMSLERMALTYEIES